MTKTTAAPTGDQPPTLNLAASPDDADWYWQITRDAPGAGTTDLVDGHGYGPLPTSDAVKAAWTADGNDPQPIIRVGVWLTQKGAALYGGDNQWAGGRHDAALEALLALLTDLDQAEDRQDYQTTASHLARSVRQLHDYLSAGGELPRPWARWRHELRVGAYVAPLTETSDYLVLRCAEHNITVGGIDIRDSLAGLIATANGHHHDTDTDEGDA